MIRSLILALMVFITVLSIPISRKAKTDTEIIMAHMKRSSQPESVIRVVERKRAAMNGELSNRDKRRSPQRRIHTSKTKDSKTN